MKLELLTNATVVDDAIRFASNHQAKEEEESTARTMIEEEQPTIRNQVF